MPRSQKQRRRKKDRRHTLTAAQWALKSRGLPIDGTAYVLAAAPRAAAPPPTLETTTACSATMSSPASRSTTPAQHHPLPAPEGQKLVRVERRRSVTTDA